MPVVQITQLTTSELTISNRLKTVEISALKKQLADCQSELASANQFICALFERLCGWEMSPTTADQDRDFINSLLTQIDIYQRGDFVAGKET